MSKRRCLFFFIEIKENKMVIENKFFGKIVIETILFSRSINELVLDLINVIYIIYFNQTTYHLISRQIS